MDPTFSEQTLDRLREEVVTIERRADELVINFAEFRFNVKRSSEYAFQGFIRRVRTLQRCIENIFTIIQPENTERPTKAQLDDEQINLQAFYANVYGATDNLAWVWAFEHDLSKLGRGKIGLRGKHKEIRASFSDDFRKYLASLDEWFDYIVDFRDAVAHRIPIYIPLRVPQGSVEKYNELQRRLNDALGSTNKKEYDDLNEEQDKLLVYQPLIAHSPEESRGQVYFHVQVIADFKTIEELGHKMLRELKHNAK